MKPLFFKEIGPEFRAKIPVSSKAAAYKLKEFLEKEFKKKFIEGQEREEIPKDEKLKIAFKISGTSDAPILLVRVNLKIGAEGFKKMVAENEELKHNICAEKIDFGGVF